MPKATPQDSPAQDDAQDFDFDAWLDNASVPEDSVTIVGKGALLAEHKTLEAELVRLRSGASDARLVDPLSERAARLREIEQEMRDSEVEFRFRQLNGAEIKAARESAPKDESGEPASADVAAAVLAASCVSPPNLTPANFLAMPARIGEQQYDELWATAWGLATSRKVTVPFSWAASVLLNNKDS